MFAWANKEKIRIRWWDFDACTDNGLKPSSIDFRTLLNKFRMPDGFGKNLWISIKNK